MKLLGMPVERRSLVFLTGDVLLAVLAIAIAWSIRFDVPFLQVDLLGILSRSTGAVTLFIISNVTTLFIAEAYEAGRDFRRPSGLLRVWGGVAVGVLFQMALYYSAPNWGMGRGVLVLSNGALVMLLTAWRVMLSQVGPRLAIRQRTLILGADQTGHVIANAIKSDPAYRDQYELVGFVDDPSEIIDPIEEPSGLSILGGRSALAAFAGAERIDTIIVAIPHGMPEELTRQLLECKAAGVRIEDMRTVYKRMTQKVPVRYVSDTSFIFGPEFAGVHGLGAIGQRIADILISALGLVLSAPIIVVAGIAVKLETEGPAFYTQTRVGQDEKPFTIIKLRTMGVDAEAKSGAVWSQGAADPRVTRVGGFLRRTRIDELPQFWNVFRGDMSMVGPRPERPHFVAQLKRQIPFYGLRFVVKPGVTGWAQVKYRYGASVDDSREKLCYDLYAIQELTPMLYALVLLKTVQTVLLKPGS